MAGAPNNKAVIVRVSGSVQGVWFRAWTKQEAEARGLKGWVRNRRDGTVEALFAGPPQAVDDMIMACYQGPPLADVAEVAKLSPEGDVPDGFEIRSGL